jgi:FkbM family methyltransferase
MVALHKRLLRRLLRWQGYELKRQHAIRGFRASYLSTLCEPATVVDVGVGYGTHELYKAFPQARFLLIEPLRDYAPALEQIAKDYECEIHYKALSDSNGSCEITVDTRDLHKSSFHERSALTVTSNPVIQRTVEVTTLDTILDENPNLSKPILLKIDTEGNELNVLKGGKRFLKETDMVIAEVSVARRFEGSYCFEELVALMYAQGFQVFDFLTVHAVKDRPRTQMTDIVFKKRP